MPTPSAATPNNGDARSTEDAVKLVDIIAALEPTFGAINLEDIKAPDCFM